MSTISVASIHLNHLTNDGISQFHKFERDVIRNSGVSEIKNHQAFADYSAAVDVLDNFTKKETESEFTAPISAADTGRDTSNKNIVDTAKIAKRGFDKTVGEAGERILSLNKKYGNVARKKLNDATEAYSDMLKNYKDKYKDDITKIGAGNWVVKLEEFNNEVYDLMHNRIDERRAKNTTDFREYRRNADDLFRLTVKIIQATMLLNGETDALIDLVKGINVVISQFGGTSYIKSNAGADSVSGSVSGAGNDSEPYPNAREWSADIDYQTCASGDIFYIIRNGVKEYYKLLDFGEVATFEPGMDDGGIWEKL